MPPAQQQRRRRKRHQPSGGASTRVRHKGLLGVLGNVRLFYTLGALAMLGSLGVGAFYTSSSLGGPGGHGGGGGHGGSADVDFVDQGGDDENEDDASDPSAQETPRLYLAPPDLNINPARTYTAEVVTDKGTISIELLPGSAPQTVNNFIFLARDGFYDGITFHRVEPDFLVQAGDPTGRGDGGPGYELPQEAPGTFSEGVVGMANASQFFVALTEDEAFEGFTPFGRVLSGLDVIRRIEPGDRIVSIEVTEAPVSSERDLDHQPAASSLPYSFL